jgi:hypothetical protein
MVESNICRPGEHLKRCSTHNKYNTYKYSSLFFIGASEAEAFITLKPGWDQEPEAGRMVQTGQQ